jgi:hypothetical protein
MKRLFLALAALAVLALPAAPAVAAPHSPTGEFKNFGDCPLSNPSVNFCVFANTTSGTFTTGKKTVPLVNPQVLQGGLIVNQETGASTFVGAEDGNTLTKAPQPVPGGLLGVVAPTWWPQYLQDWFNNQINEGLTGVTATVELAAPASQVQLNLLAIFAGKGTALQLPVKIKLSNAILGNNCYIGSNSSPIVIPFTTGTTAPPPPNTPITGSKGEIQSNEAGTLLVSKNNKLVNNSFAAPGANGCGGFLFSWAIDPLVNSVLGIPSPAGTNTAILEGTTEFGNVIAVKASEP